MGLPNVFRVFTGQDHTDNNSGGDKRDKHMSESPKAEPKPQPTELNLNIEANRLRTFENWSCTYVDKEQLALFGFYYYGPSDMVKCYFCGVEIGMWEEGDDALTDHMRWSPYCNLIRRNETNNVPIDEAVLNQALPPAPTPDVYGAMERTNTVSEGTIASISEDDVHMYQHQLYRQGGIDAVLQANSTSTSPRPTMSRPEHPEFAVEAKRIESYDAWPKTLRQKPQQLSDAGFFYTSKGDRVCCFSCGGGLKDWEVNDDPWEQHAMWYGKCEYVKLMKDADFLQKMAAKREIILKSSNEDPSGASCSSQSSQESLKLPETSTCESLSPEPSEKSDEEEEKKDSKLCKICYNNEYNTIFLPCGHVIACAKCASSVTKCPACRQPFDNVMRVYFS